ncbi:MAG: hypothetical protein PX483_07780 [Nostocales cyanobacterium LE14-WE4]|nr:hypothetical protein [Anabaena sp. 49633_E8]MCE2703493.1 hypothetical protein [Anabaena sp. 49633_E8]MDJ0500742.1 hypothetical protein [Nostocales cyanobacterium LE14-WE4]
MNLQNFLEFQNLIRTYNSKSILQTGTDVCWEISETKYLEAKAWLNDNARRNYTIRIILLASAGNPYRSNKINYHDFNKLIYAYFNWNKHTIVYPDILEQEAETIWKSIQIWETNNPKKVRNLSFKLSHILDKKMIRPHMSGLFLQRQASFQNAGYGKQVSRIQRAIKFIEFLDNLSHAKLSEAFLKSIGLEPTIYFSQFLGCLALFKLNSRIKGFCDFSQFPIIDKQIQDMGISKETLKLFIKQNSAPFHSESKTSFRSRVKEKINAISEVYQPFFYNFLLDTPFIQLDEYKFYLPDPFSLTESCWNQIEYLILKHWNQRELANLLSDTFEHYLESVLFPYIASSSFERISEVSNPQNSSDKRADFIIRLSNSYILVECKNSTMFLDTSTYFHPEGIAELWCRIHMASQQIASTIKALNLKDKPVIPLIMTFYDNIVASEIFEAIIQQTDYCSSMGFTIPPIVRSLHEFEHWTSDRSLNNWAESILQKHNTNSFIKADNKGHNYQHLDNISII